MNCTHVQKNLLVGMVGGRHAVEVLAHLRKCKGCVQKLDSLRRIMVLLDEWKVPEPSRYFLTGLWPTRSQSSRVAVFRPRS
jgi:hypothetical protein